MALSKQSLEILLDLIEIKLNALQIQDRDDARELNKLRKCRQELTNEQSQLPKKKECFLKPTASLESPQKKTSYSRY